jgi:hypothetical protein
MRRPRIRRLLWRLATFVVLFAVADVALVWLDFAPDQLRLLLLSSLGFAVVLLVLDALADDAPRWHDEPVQPMTVPGGDLRLAAFVRLLESHLTATVPDAALRDRLGVLCDERLARKHSLTRRDPAAEALLGTDLLRDLAGPVRRLSRTDVRRYLERIENL